MYIDPNTGGMLFQILAVVFGIFSGTVLIFSSKIRQFFGRINRLKSDSDSQENSHPTQDDTGE